MRKRTLAVVVATAAALALFGAQSASASRTWDGPPHHAAPSVVR